VINANLAGDLTDWWALEMTEYTVKEIGHQWMVYADRKSIAACADEAAALKLIAEDSAAKFAMRKSTVHGTSASEQRDVAGRKKQT
jgi:hypothetical protein